MVDRNLQKKRSGWGWLMTGKKRSSEEASDGDTEIREREDSGFNSQMVTLSSGHALAPSPPNVEVSQLGHSACFWEWGLHIPSFPSTQFFMLVVISCNSHLQGGEVDPYGRGDKSFVHQNNDKYNSIVLH